MAVVLALLSTLFVATTPPAGAAAPTVVFNEISQRINPDWVEFTNVSPDPVDISGWTFQDDMDRGPDDYVFPAGTILEPGEFFVLDAASGDTPGFSFGLGAQDIVRLSDAEGNLVDSFQWEAHAATTYGRCPDGTGEFQLTAEATRGAPNDCTTAVRINEIESSGGVPGDWIELINPSAHDEDISGHILRDDDDSHTWTAPADTIIPAGGYLVVEEADLGFGLGAADSVRWFSPGETLVDSYSWTAHAATTYGRCPDGTGEFEVTAEPTKGGPNACEAIPGQNTIKLNEIESNLGVPGDWIELVNIGDEPVDLGGWLLRDDNDVRFSEIEAGTIIEPGGFYVHEEAQLGFGLGAPDMARLYTPGGTLVDSYSWTTHAATTYGRCPDGTGDFQTTTTPTKGAANDCGTAVRINEIESSGGVPGDWIELVNPGVQDEDISGFILRDDDDSHTWTAPAETVIPSGGYLVVEEADLGFGLGAADAVRLFSPEEELLDSYAWLTHAPTTYGRCPDATGPFEVTLEPTKGAPNRCEGEPEPPVEWPGGQDVVVADLEATFDGDLSGLDYQATGTSAPGVLWAVDNGRGVLHRLLWNGSAWVTDTADGWSAGKTLRYPDGTGTPDSEGVTVNGDGHVVVGTERNNASSGVSRNSLLKFDPAGSDTTLTAITEWELTDDLPSVGPNLGIEAVEWVADGALVAGGFVDESTGELYDPADYAGHDGGVYFIGIEGTGLVYGYVLLADGDFQRVAEIDPHLIGVMALDYDVDTDTLWAVCDDGCQGRSALLQIDGDGVFAVAGQVARPEGMPNLNNEGFAITPATRCVDGFRPVYWADDGDTDGHSIRAGTLPCPDTGPGDHGFEDVAEGNVHADAITELVARGIVLGTSPTTFAPERSVTRGQLASLIARALDLAPVAPSFPDVSPEHAHAGAIGAVAGAGLVLGFADGTFRPEQPIIRGQVAAVLARWVEVTGHDEDHFSDIATSVHRRAINGLADLDIARGDTEGRFRPGADLRRDQMASLLVRVLHHLEGATT